MFWIRITHPNMDDRFASMFLESKLCFNVLWFRQNWHYLALAGLIGGVVLPVVLGLIGGVVLVIISGLVDVVLLPVVLGLIGGVVLVIISGLVDVVLLPVVLGLIGGVVLPVVLGLIGGVVLPVKACFNITSCLNADGETEMQLKDTILVGSQLNEKLPLLLGTLIHGSTETLLDVDEQRPRLNWLRGKIGLS